MKWNYGVNLGRTGILFGMFNFALIENLVEWWPILTIIIRFPGYIHDHSWTSISTFLPNLLQINRSSDWCPIYKICQNTVLRSQNSDNIEYVISEMYRENIPAWN